MAAYLTADELALAWGEATMIQLFDDRNTGEPNQLAIDSVISRATARTNSVIATNYTGTLPLASPYAEMAKELTYEYAWALALPRNPDYMRALGVKIEDVYKRAEALALDLQTAIKRMIDAPAPTPANVGGDVYSMATDPNYPEPPTPVFIGGMGDW